MSAQGNSNVQGNYIMLAIMHAQEEHQPSLSEFGAAPLPFGEATILGCRHQRALVVPIIAFERHLRPPFQVKALYHHILAWAGVSDSLYRQQGAGACGSGANGHSCRDAPVAELPAQG